MHADNPPRVSPYPMVAMDEALATIVDTLDCLTAETVPPRQALHRVLAADVHAPGPLPPFRASVKDGYAVVAASAYSPDAPFLVVSHSVAGADPGQQAPALAPGQCVYITTGAPLPPGADAVVMVEHSSPAREGATVLFDRWVSGPGADVRQIGCDVEAGQLILPKGTVVGAAELGILIGCGVPSVHAVRTVRIGVMSTGDEILDDRDVKVESSGSATTAVGTSGKIIDSNRPMLLAAVTESLPFCEAVDLGIVKDDYDAVRAALVAARDTCDVVLTSGGVSMGSRDVVKPVLAKIATVHFGRVCMKPGKPLTYATFNGRNRCVVSVPGNPVSAFVCFHLAVSAAAKILGGWPREKALGTVIDVTLVHDIKLDPERPEYHRATLQWQASKYYACSTGGQASSRLLSARSAQGLLILPAAEGIISGGSQCQAYLLDHPR